MKQIKYVDQFEEGREHIGYGILTDDGDCICACCGGLFEKGERGEMWDVIKIYDNWVDFSEFIAE